MYTRIEMSNSTELGNVEGLLTRTKSEIMGRRHELVRLYDGDMFYKMSLWPATMLRIFWKKPISDRETFKLVLFLYNNGCPKDIIIEWVVTSTYWQRDKMRKRIDQMDWIFRNMERFNSNWFYYDLFHNRYFYVNGCERETWH